MRTGRYSISELFEFANLEQFVIPEIQRDYVWSRSEISDLLESIKDGFINNDKPYLGFIYAYNDKDYVYKYFLIDGQQRMTTIFLLLVALYFKLGKDFPEHVIKNKKLKLDYKVRQATHDFLYDFISFLNNHKGIALLDEEIEEQSWYHLNYVNDITILNIVNNFNDIYKWLGNIANGQLTDFLNFIENEIQLSYYDIENGRQGEELYIYMNSRGRHLVENETLKAKFLSKLLSSTDKENWGRKWEEWQDFFWVNRLSNPDSDQGFNQFLRLIQIITMSNKDYSPVVVNKFITSNESIDFNILPELNEIEKCFKAYEYLVNNTFISEFFKKYESDNYLLKTERRQIDYFRILPIIAFVSIISNYNDKSILRFIRFIYNLSRKSNISKDIRTNLVSAIRLLSEYGKHHSDNYEVCDLVDYAKSRTVLLDSEEVLKLSLFINPPPQTAREELELLFWEIEDNSIFNGEISFLLKPYYDTNHSSLNYDEFTKSWFTFKELFSAESNNKYISKALVYYGNTWKKESPYYYNNYNCQDWSWLVANDKGKYLLQLIKDMHVQNFDYIKTLIKTKISDYFLANNYINIAEIKQSSGFFNQIKIIVAIDFYADDKIWARGSHIAEDNRYSWKDDADFFNEKRVFYNVDRYVRGGYDGRILSFMKNILTNETRLTEIINQINNPAL